MPDNVTTMAPVSLKDYIIDMGDTKKSAPTVTYSVVLENNTDFIIRRQTQKTQRELVIMISQGLYYIRDCKDGSIDPVSLTNLNQFLRDLKYDALTLEQVYWLPELCKESGEFISRVIGNALLTDMCRHNIPIDMNNPGRHVRYWEQNKKLYTRIAQLFPQEPMAPQKYENSLPLIFWIEEKFGTNEAMYLAEKLVQSGVRSFNFGHGYRYDANGDIDSFTKIIESEYNINLRRFIDYICFDLYRQGYGEIPGTFFHEYMDYLDMQKSFYGKVKEKYPENFKTAHDVIALKINQAKAAEQCLNFTEQAEAVKHLEYAHNGYCIVVPTSPQELADEGINLSHCVGSYIERVASGECHILFLRRKSTPEKSLVTLQLSGKRIVQAQGINRRGMTGPERKFLQHWGSEKDIEIMA